MNELIEILKLLEAIVEYLYDTEEDPIYWEKLQNTYENIQNIIQNLQNLQK